MPLATADSVATMPPRRVHLRSESQMARTGIKGPSYTIQRDAPWMAETKHDSVYSETSDDVEGAARLTLSRLDERNDETDHAAPGATSATPASTTTNTARSETPANNDPGLASGPGSTPSSTSNSHVRQSRMPLFKQVRSILNKHSNSHSDKDKDKDKDKDNKRHHPVLPPSANASTPDLPVTPNNKHSYSSVFHKRQLSSQSTVYEAYSPNATPQSNATSQNKSKKAGLPPSLRIGSNTVDVNNLRINSLRIPTEPPSSPLSISPLSAHPPSPTNAFAPSPPVHVQKRKPTPGPPKASAVPEEDLSLHRAPSSKSNWSWAPSAIAGADTESTTTTTNSSSNHFSWANFANLPRPSFTKSRPSTRDASYPQPEDAPPPLPPIIPLNLPGSRFSWSTVHSGSTHAVSAPGSEPLCAPPTAPLPPLPTTKTELDRTPSTATSLYNPPRGPPVQSILSRRRPVERFEKEQWAPPPRIRTDGPRSFSASVTALNGTSEAPSSLLVPRPNTSTDRSVSNPLSHRPSTASSTSSSSTAKALPLPPTISTPTTPLSHLDTLLAQERDIQVQRRNTERMIASLGTIATASPMDVSFSAVRETNEQLKQHQRRLEQIQLEEREVGVAISRARRKEEGEEGLWVRRVMG